MICSGAKRHGTGKIHIKSSLFTKREEDPVPMYNILLLPNDSKMIIFVVFQSTVLPELADLVEKRIVYLAKGTRSTQGVQSTAHLVKEEKRQMMTGLNAVRAIVNVAIIIISQHLSFTELCAAAKRRHAA